MSKAMSLAMSMARSETSKPIAVWTRPYVRKSRSYSRNRSAFAIAYSAVVTSGFLMGLLCGWAVWG